MSTKPPSPGLIKQIRWGLDYILARYGPPPGYAEGGRLPGPPGHAS